VDDLEQNFGLEFRREGDEGHGEICVRRWWALLLVGDGGKKETLSCWRSTSLGERQAVFQINFPQFISPHPLSLYWYKYAATQCEVLR
jgi:hypothetical protein